MGVVADLLVHVGADIGSFKSGMTEVGAKVDEAGGGFAKFGGLALGAGVAVAGLATGVAAFGIAAVAKVEAAGQAAYEMSEKFGLLPGTASAWLSVGNQLGVSSETIGKGFKFLAKNAEAMALTLQAGGHISAMTLQPYKDLGLTVLDASGKVKSADELMLEAADTFKNMPDGIEKTALAMKLFGKSGADMIPVLNQGRSGIEALMASGKSMGDVMSGPQVEAAHKLYLQHKQLDTAIAGVTTQIGVFLMPVMISIMSFVTGTAVPAIQKFGAYFEEHLLPAITQVWAAFMSLLAPALKYIQSHFEDLKPVLIAVGIVIGVMLGAAVIAIGLVVLAVVGLVAGIAWLVGEFRRFFPQLLGHVQDFVVGTVQHFEDIVTFVKGLPGKITAAAAGLWDGLLTGFRNIYNTIAGDLNRLIDAFNQLPHFGAPSMGHIPTMHGGGTVPGPVGSNVLAILQAGETVGAIGSGGGGSGGGGLVYSPTYNVSGGNAAELRAMLDQHDRDFMTMLRMGALGPA